MFQSKITFLPRSFGLSVNSESVGSVLFFITVYKMPNIQRVYQAARTYNREPIPTVIEADITPLLEAPDATDEY